MMEVYYCRDCGKYFTDDELDEKQICYEEEYGVAGDFNTKTYENVSCCPNCQSTDYEEETDYEEIMRIVNSYNSNYNYIEKGKKYDKLINSDITIIGGKGKWESFEQIKKAKDQDSFEFHNKMMEYLSVLRKDWTKIILKKVKKYNGNFYDIISELNKEYGLDIDVEEYYNE